MFDTATRGIQLLNSALGVSIAGRQVDGGIAMVLGVLNNTETAICLV